MKPDTRIFQERFILNMRRIAGLVHIANTDYVNPKTAEPFQHTQVSADILRSATVFLHATCEDFPPNEMMSIKPVLSYFLLTQLLFIATEHAAELSVSVGGVSSDRGHVVIDVCTREQFLGPRCAYHGSTPAKPGTVIVNVASVSPGSYAIQAYHDENDNLTVDRNFLGIPNEAIGFSNNAPMRFGPPRFDDAEVIVPPEGIRTALQLHSIWP